MESVWWVLGLLALAALGAWASKVDAERRRLTREREEWEKQVASEKRSLAEDKAAIDTLAKEKSLGFPWLAKAYAEYFELRDRRVADYLDLKSHPAHKAAQHVREISGKRREAERLWRILKYQLEYYEALFPWLVDFKGEDLDDLVRKVVEKLHGEASVDGDEEEDPVRHWVTEAEYRNLPATEKNQLALNRYWQKKKTSWELGRDYERFIGYGYETSGWKVRYQGIMEGLSDLGRDLVAEKDGVTEIAQCKYWAREKVIHEKHIFQLYGTLVAYRIDHSGAKVRGVFVTSTRFSDRARQFASALDISLREGVALEPYPCIKCNIGRRDGTKIYHLPFDQQYDRTDVSQLKFERYVMTVAEAEALGFRRAFRWRGEEKPVGSR